MPGPLPTRCIFPKDFLQQARQTIRRRTVPFQTSQRFRLVLLLHEQPDIHNHDAGQAVGRSARQVKRWRRRWVCGDFTVQDQKGRGRKPTFSPLQHAHIHALACEVVAQTQQPLSRQALTDLTDRAQKLLDVPISRTSVWRSLHEAAIKPWQFRHWLFFPAMCLSKAKQPSFWICMLACGKTNLSPTRITSSHVTRRPAFKLASANTPRRPPGPKQTRRVEPEYTRRGALPYLAAWDVTRGYGTGRCEAKNGIASFTRLVDPILQQPPYCDARHLFLVVDNGSSHRGQTSKERAQTQDSRVTLVHTPVHARWLNQVEVYFSIIQRKVLTPNDFANRADLELRLKLYEEKTNRPPKPFSWKYTRQDMERWLKRAMPHIEATQTG